MKGIVFNLLQEVVVAELGADIWDDLLDSTGLEGAYTSLGSYADEEVVLLVNAAATALDKPPAEILRWFGRKAMPLLGTRYPAFFSPHNKTRSFLLTLNNIIHPEVQKLYPGALTPVFDFDNDDSAVLRIGYRSQRRMCALAEGFILGASDHFGETITVVQTQCMHDGADKCLFEIQAAK